MPRFLSRREMPFIAAGVTAGLLTSFLILYFFVTGIGGTPAVERPQLVADPERIPRAETRPGAVEPPPRGVIGRRMAGIERRLGRFRVDARPLRAPVALTLSDVAWDDPAGRSFARIDRATGRLDVGGAVRGNIVVTDVVLTRPVVELREDGAGDWNYEAVLADLLEPEAPRPPGAPRRLVQFRDVRIEDGTVDVRRPADRFAFLSVAARLPVVSLSQPGIEDAFIRAAAVTTTFARDDTRLDLSVADGFFQFPDGTVRFDLAAADIGDTRLTRVRGDWDPARPGYGVAATGTAPDVDLADIRFIAPDLLPATGTASFAFEVAPVPPDENLVALTALDARAEGSILRGAVSFRWGPSGFALLDADLLADPLQLALVERFTGPLPYAGALRGPITGVAGDLRFDLQAALTAATVPEGFLARLEGRVLLGADGAVLRALDIGLDRVPLAALRALVPGLPLEGLVTGRIALTGPPAAAPLGVDVRLELGAGVAFVEGEIDLTGEVATYDLTGRVVGVDLQAVLAPDVPPVALTATFSLSGAGTDAASMTADVRVAGRFTGWETTAADTIHLVTRIRSGVALVDAAYLRLATAELEASGEWRFVAPVAGSITYALDVASLRPFGPYIPAIGDPTAGGALLARGTLAGSLDRPTLAGGVSGTNLRVGGWQAGSLAAEYDLAFGDPVPRAIVDLRGRALATPTAGRFSEAVLDLRLDSPILELDFTATRPDGGRIEVVATGDVPQVGPRIIVLEQAAADIEEGRWELVEPATLVWTDAGLLVERLELSEAETEGRILVAGRILPLADADVTLDVAALPVDEVQRLFGREPVIAGKLWAEGRVLGGATPVVRLDFRVEQGMIEEVPLRRFDGRVAYADGRATATARLETDTAGVMDLELELPSLLRLDAEPAFELVDGTPLRGTVTASRFSLAPFRAAFPDVRELRGLIDGQATLSGSADAPRVEGELALTAGHVRIPALNQRYTDIAGRVAFVGRDVAVEDLRIRSDGWAMVSGNVVLERLNRPVVDLDIDFSGFRPVGVPDQDDAAVDGRVELTGPPDALVMTGRIEVGDGDVVLPEFDGGIDAELLDITRPGPALDAEPRPVADTWLRNLRIEDLVVDVREDAWFQIQAARAQLGGQLVINKVQDETPIVGELEGSRGQYTLVAGPIIRRFQIVAAQVRFLGTPTPDPAVDITVRRVIIDAAGRPVDVDVRITGTASAPTLAVGSAELAALPESELLSFLLFGQPSFAVGGDILPGDRLIEQTFLGGFAEIAALELERTFAGLGFDIFQIRLGAGPVGGIGSPTFVIGRELAPDVFLTLETGMVALFGGATGDTPLNMWAARLDWNFDRRSRARLALEPVYRGRSLRGPGLALPITDPQQQFLIELRRRWTW